MDVLPSGCPQPESPLSPLDGGGLKSGFTIINGTECLHAAYAEMSTRGLNFFDKWIAEHLPDTMTDDPAVISDLADEAMEAAHREGIEVAEIYEEVGSVFEVIADAMQHREGSLPEGDQAALDLLAARLARQASITEKQASELIDRVGHDWNSLLNEAYFVKELEGRLRQE